MNKKAILIIALILVISGFVLANSNTFGQHTGAYGYPQIWNYSSGDLIVDDILVNSDLNVSGNIYAENATFYDLIVRSGQSITLAGAKFENEGTFTSVNTDFGIHEDGEPTAFLGVYAHNDSIWTHANIIMEAGVEGSESIANLVKNSDIHPYSPDSFGIINDGNIGNFIPEGNQISDWTFSNFSKDEYGNIQWLELEKNMRILNETGLWINGTGTFYADSDNQSFRFYENNGGEYINVKMDSKGDLNFYSDSGDSRLEIPDSNQQSDNSYRGIGVNGLYHLYGGDTDTTMQFGDNLINFYAGGDGYMQFRNYEKIGWQSFVAVNYWNKDIDFKWDSDNNDDAVFFEGSSGNVGIGTNTPTQKLDVNGNVNVSGSLTADKIYFTNSGNEYMDYTTGDNWFRFSTGIEATDITASGDLNGDELTVSTADVTDYLETPIIYNTDGDTLTIQDNLDIIGDVENDENGNMLYIRRCAPEGCNYMRAYITSNRDGMFHSNADMTFQGQTTFTINSVDDSINFKVGDNAGAEKFNFKDSDGNPVITIDSNGVMTLDKNNGAYLNLVRGTQNKISNFFDSTYTDLRFEGSKEYNRIGTWMNKSFQIMTDSTERITIDGISGDVNLIGNTFIGGVLDVDVIGEKTGGEGVTIEGVQFKDDGMHMGLSESIFFYDPEISISSESDGHLDLYADEVIDMNAQEIRLHGEVEFSQSEVTIGSGGTVTVVDSNHRIDTYADGASDNLDTINGGQPGQILFLRTVDNGRDVTLRDEQDNIKLTGGVDFTMDTRYDNIMLIYDTTGGGMWFEISRSDID